MKRKIYLELEIDWDNYDDVCDELVLEDSGIMDNIKDGVHVTIQAKPNINPALLLAGKLALKARLVTTATAKNLSTRIEEIEYALDNYDNEIMSLLKK